jgi:hypothetical protein
MKEVFYDVSPNTGARWSSADIEAIQFAVKSVAAPMGGDYLVDGSDYIVDGSDSITDGT